MSDNGYIKNSCRILSGILALAGIAMFAGCAASGPGKLQTSSYTMTASDDPMQFSDEQSREWIRQTQKLKSIMDEDYRVGPDDVLEISVFEWQMGEKTETLEFRVSETGDIVLPSIGAMNVVNKSVKEIQQALVEELESSNLIQNPRVAVSVKEYRSLRISVIGAVNLPGVYAIHQNVTTLLDMLTLAGGPSADAGRAAYVLRPDEKGKQLRVAIDLEDLLEKGNYEYNAILQGGDVIQIPRAPSFFVYGKVANPGGYTISRSLRILEAVALAGGLQWDADQSGCYIIRRFDNGNEQRIPVSITAIERGEAPNIFVHQDDVIHVPQSGGKFVMAEAWDVFRGVFTFTYRLDDN